MKNCTKCNSSFIEAKKQECGFMFFCTCCGYALFVVDPKPRFARGSTFSFITPGGSVPQCDPIPFLKVSCANGFPKRNPESEMLEYCKYSLKELESLLEDAVEKENYEFAARIRDKINNLK